MSGRRMVRSQNTFSSAKITQDFSRNITSTSISKLILLCENYFTLSSKQSCSRSFRASVFPLTIEPESPDLIATPNPASEQINVSYTLPLDTEVQVGLLDQSGKIIKVLKGGGAINRQGRHLTHIDSKQLPNGTYVIRLTTSQGVQNCRVIIIK